MSGAPDRRDRRIGGRHSAGASESDAGETLRAHVTVSIDGRGYRLACRPGEEPHLLSLAQEIESTTREIRSTFGEVGGMRAIVMAALLMADRAQGAEEDLETLRSEQQRERDATIARLRKERDRLYDALEQAGQRIAVLGHTFPAADTGEAAQTNPPSTNQERGNQEQGDAA